MPSQVRKLLLIATMTLLVAGAPMGAANAASMPSAQPATQRPSVVQPIAPDTSTLTSSAEPEKLITKNRPGLVREPAGKYYSFCISLGVSHPWTGKAPASCPGYLDVYINGDHVAHVNTGRNGGMISVTCAGGIALGLVTLFAPGGEVVGWALAGTLAGIGFTIAGCAGV